MSRVTFETLLEAVPANPSEIPAWETLCAWMPVLEPLDACGQDPIHHAEGDVGTHTRMVVRELVSSDEWASLDEEAHFRLFWAAVLHDIGKPDTKKEEDGRITNRNHSRIGASIARRVLRGIGIPFSTREEICAIITAHQVPFHLYDKPDRERRCIGISLTLKPSELLLHARSDALGRDCADKDDLLMRLDLARLEFENLGCLDGPFAFENDESRVAYFSTEGRNPFYAAHEEFDCEVTVMSGLPGSGKDTWIARNRPYVPVVSLDALREEMDVDATDNQGQVEQAAKERVKEMLRTRQSFVFNTTNITADMRGKILRLVRDYNRVCRARITMVYIEPPPAVLLSQNAERSASVPAAVIDRLVRKLDPPKPWEAHETIHVTKGLPEWHATQSLAFRS